MLLIKNVFNFQSGGHNVCFPATLLTVVWSTMLLKAQSKGHFIGFKHSKHLRNKPCKAVTLRWQLLLHFEVDPFILIFTQVQNINLKLKVLLSSDLNFWDFCYMHPLHISEQKVIDGQGEEEMEVDHFEGDVIHVMMRPGEPSLIDLQ